MKAYYEYEDGTFWAIITEGNCCFTCHGSKYGWFYPDFMQKIGTKKENNWTPNGEKITFADSVQAEKEAAELSRGKSIGSLKQDAEFWRIAIEINATLLFFVPEKYRTEALYSLAVRRKGDSLRYVPAEKRSKDLCNEALGRNKNVY